MVGFGGMNGCKGNGSGPSGNGSGPSGDGSGPSSDGIDCIKFTKFYLQN